MTLYMSKVHNKIRAKKTLANFLTKRISEGFFLLILTSGLLVLIALTTYRLPEGRKPLNFNMFADANACGQVGAYVAGVLFLSFGYFSYLIPLFFIYAAWLVCKNHHLIAPPNPLPFWLRFSGFFFILIAGCSLLSLYLPSKIANLHHGAGGLLGSFVAESFYYAFNLQGAFILLTTLMLIGITLLTGFSWINFVELIGFYTLFMCNWTIRSCIYAIKLLPKFFAAKKRDINFNKNLKINHQKLTTPQLAQVPTLSAFEVPLATSNIKPITATPVSTIIDDELPSLDLLDPSQSGKIMGGYSHQELETMSREVEQHLLDFGIQADVVAVHPGPVITRFELQLAAGIKVNKLSSLAKDLARSMSVISVRVVEVIPGKTVVGIELPNQQRDMVRLQEVLSTDVYQQAHSPLTLALGVDIAGHPMIVDLAKMPHLLVAGTTGSGKSVGINAMILSILFKSSPKQVRLIMVDPKMLELSVYDNIPHLLTPVVTDMKEAASALRWCVNEMERRYRIMATLGVRNLAGFNTKINNAIEKGERLLDPLWKGENPPNLQSLPYIVVIIDELADLMMVVGKKVEQLIARIAQKARAAGIHLILATQRPSVDVLTGLIKSNIPTRMSFQVSSKIDSRTILDQQGAEQLLGHGDLLYLSPGSGAPMRGHGAFVDDKEVHRVASDWRARGEPIYIDSIKEFDSDNFESETKEENNEASELDSYYDQAVEFVVQTRKSSISAIQRRLKIGYNRAARIVEEMERTGILGPLEGGVRDVLAPTVADD